MAAVENRERADEAHPAAMPMTAFERAGAPRQTRSPRSSREPFAMKSIAIGPARHPPRAGKQSQGRKGARARHLAHDGGFPRETLADVRRIERHGLHRDPARGVRARPEEDRAAIFPMATPRRL
jgi:hypothetical protein